MDNYKDEYEELDDSEMVGLELSAENARGILREINSLVRWVDPRVFQGSSLQNLGKQVANSLQAIRTPMNLSDNELQVIKGWGFTHHTHGVWTPDDQELASRLSTEIQRRELQEGEPRVRPEARKPGRS